ncbi:uncharacterized protein TrAFT101_010111 [Trichoderma asperellum]|uniref:uncharacterized protein n=1 Tax=Trichoderma asperellum TaxID=101201 RepID=UPI003326728B|nr:hypothetical protein TrAFT101_010111 [Trichoderma asperellum]
MGNIVSVMGWLWFLIKRENAGTLSSMPGWLQRQVLASVAAIEVSSLRFQVLVPKSSVNEVFVCGNENDGLLSVSRLHFLAAFAQIIGSGSLGGASDECFFGWIWIY